MEKEGWGRNGEWSESNEKSCRKKSVRRHSEAFGIFAEWIEIVMQIQIYYREVVLPFKQINKTL